MTTSGFYARNLEYVGEKAYGNIGIVTVEKLTLINIDTAVEISSLGGSEPKIQIRHKFYLHPQHTMVDKDLQYQSRLP
jgi:hypothetical protein